MSLLKPPSAFLISKKIKFLNMYLDNTQVPWELLLRTLSSAPYPVPLLLGWSSNRSIITIINSSTYRVIILGDKRNMDAFVGTSTGILKSTLHIFSIKYS